MNKFSLPDLIDELPLALLVADSGGQIVFRNKTAEEFGLKALDIGLQELLARVMAEGAVITVHDHVIRVGSQMLRAAVHVQPIAGSRALFTIDSQGDHHSPAASEWKKETARAAGVMAAMLAHEVKNPLSGIRGAAQLLREEVTEEHQALADLICSETDRIRDLLDQIEIFSDERRSEKAPLNIHEVLQYAIKVSKPGFASHVRFEEHYDPSLPLVSSQRELLVQVILNIIKNAAEALAGAKNPTITILTQYKQAYRKGSVALPILVHIRDNGPGIPTHVQPQLFEPFVSTKAQGKGLGLAIVAKLAADLGIVVELEDNISHGTGFTICLPCA